MSQKEKAFIYASIQIRAEAEKKGADKLKQKGGKRRWRH